VNKIEDLPNVEAAQDAAIQDFEDYVYIPSHITMVDTEPAATAPDDKLYIVDAIVDIKRAKDPKTVRYQSPPTKKFSLARIFLI
jgi:hypothetical protein